MADDVRRQLELLRQWLNSQPHLPQDLEERVLRRFLHSCSYDVEQTKQAAETFCVMRAAAPALFCERDPRSAALQTALSITKLVRFEISGNRNLWIWQLDDPGMRRFDYVQDAKLYQMVTDAWMLEDERLEDGDIALVDLKGVTMKYLTKMNMSIAKMLAKYQEEALPVKLKQIHFVNAPNFINIIYSVFKPLVSQHVLDTIHFHTAGSQKLFEFIPREELPPELGGDGASLDLHFAETVALLTRRRQDLLNDNLWKAVDKSKTTTMAAAPEEAAPFRDLAID